MKIETHIQKIETPVKTIPKESFPAQLPKIKNDSVEISHQKIEKMKIDSNNPDDPTVSTKVLDSLSTGMINFSQEQRDALATILSDRAAQTKMSS